MPGALRFERLSWHWKLPLLVAGLSILTVSAFGVVSYRQVRAAELQATQTRLRSALGEISAIVALGSVNQLETLGLAAGNPVLGRALEANGRVDSATIAGVTELAGKSGAVAVAELLDSVGAVRYRHGTTALLHPGTAPIARPTIGELFQQDSVLFFWSSAPVFSGDRQIGIIRVARRVGGAANSRIVTRLVGDHAGLLIGNDGGQFWKSGRPVNVELADSSLTRYARGGTTWVALSLPLKDTPWRYAIELPEADATARARDLVWPFLISGFVIALLSGLLGLFVSRSITTPLRELTEASEGIARGDQSVTLTASHRHDEIGRLARAFGTMAVQVRAIVERLEAAVDARSGELNAAVGRLQQLDEQLQQNARLASLGRAYGSIGHELRNPLGVMSNVIWLLDALPDASPKLTEYSRLLREQLRLSERIIADLLDRTRSVSRTPTPVDVSELLDEALQRASLPAHIRLERQIDPLLSPVVLDRDQVGQIIWNLIQNAVQAMSASGGVLTVSAHVADRRLRVEIRDSGSGVHPDDVERIFQPLFTTKADGVGLGLSISREFARANGGDLFAVIIPGGACFVLDLPVASNASSDVTLPTPNGISADLSPGREVEK